MKREQSYGQGYAPTLVDRFGQWLSFRRVAALLGGAQGQDLADIGCGYHAAITRGFLGACRSLTLVDLALEPGLKKTPKVRAIEGRLPGVLRALRPASLDAVLFNSVLEHLEEPLPALRALHKALRPGALLWVNVPSWRGKYFLELSAFRLGLSPAGEMDDHKAYYDPRDLWPLLVKAGFKPSQIDCGKHKFGLNTWALCRKAAA